MIILAFLAAAALPQPAELKTFRDWTVGCDNGLACHAVALIPDAWPEDAATMSVRRGPERGARPEIKLDIDAEDGVSLAADGRKLTARLLAGEGGPRVAPADAGTVIAAMRSARQLQILGSDGRALATMSLSGASAALLYMDDRQGRVGSSTALVRSGPRPAADFATPLPKVNAASGGSGFDIGKELIAGLRKQADCLIGDVGGPDEYDAAPIDGRHMLVLLACGSGAYNVTYIPYIAASHGGKPRFRIAEFDIKPGWWEDGRPALINAVWDPARRRLDSFAKGRGLGDCGTISEYAWDGSRFRLTHQAEMHECRGSTDYITTWRAEVASP